MADATLAYPIGDRLYVNLTDRCTLRCQFCPKFNGTRQLHEHDLTLTRRPEVDEIIEAIGKPRDFTEIVFCGYGEPTLRLKALLAIATWLKGQRARVRVNTDGLGCLVNKRNILPELAGKVDSLSVSLNAQDEITYQRHCRPQLPGSYAAVQAFLRAAPTYVPEVTATAIHGLPGVGIAACAALARRLGVRFRRRELDVVG